MEKATNTISSILRGLRGRRRNEENSV